MGEKTERWKAPVGKGQEVQGMSRGTGVGMASILLIAMVLAFTTFGILSLVSALSDVRMSRKTLATAAAYYEAEGRLQEQLAKLDADLLAGRAEIPDHGLWELKEDVQEVQQLLLIVERRDETEKGGGRYTVLWQRLVNTMEWNPEPGVEIWDGGM